MVNKFENLINDEAFISKLENAKNDDELIALFKANGVKITIEEIKEMMLGGNTEELNEESLTRFLVEQLVTSLVIRLHVGLRTDHHRVVA